MYNKFIKTSTFYEATFRDILLPSLNNLKDYIAHIQMKKWNIQTWTETIKLTDKKKLHNITNWGD